MVFDPKLQTQVGYSQPAQAPASDGGLGSILGALSNVISAQSGQTSGGGTSGEPDWAGVANWFEASRQARDQGNDAQARQIETEATIRASQLGINTGGEQFRNLYSQVTGRDHVSIGRTQQEIVIEQAFDDPEFQIELASASRLTHENGDNLTEEEAQAVALGNYQNRQALRHSVETAGLRWDTGGQNDTMSLINSSLAPMHSLLVNADEGDTVSVADLDQAELMLANLSANLTKPAPLTAAQWEPIKNKLELEQQRISLLRSVVGAGTERGVAGVTSQLEAQQGLRIAELNTALVMSPEMMSLDPLVQASIMATLEKNPGSLLQQMAGGTTDLNAALVALSTVSVNSETLRPNPANLNTDGTVSRLEPTENPVSIFGDPEEIVGISNYDVETAFGNVQYYSEGYIKATTDFSSPETRDAVGTAISAALLDTYNVAHKGETFAEGAVMKFFDGRFMNAIEAIGQHDPATAATLYRQGNVALERMQTTAVSRIDQLEGSSRGLTITRDESGTPSGFEISESALIERFGAEKTNQFITLANTYFGGDLDEAIKKIQGRAPIKDPVTGQVIPFSDISGEFGGAFDVAGSQWSSNLVLTGDRIEKEFDALRAITAKRQEFFDRIPRQDDVDDIVSSTREMLSNGWVSQDLGIDFGAYERESGLPTGYLERTAQIESSGNPNAQNPSSSAGGLFQQLDANWSQYGNPNGDRTNPVDSTEAAVKFASENQRTLRRSLGRDPSAAELYLAHQQGPGGASALLGNPNSPAITVLTRVHNGNYELARQSIELNGGNVEMTAQQFANIWINKFNSGEAGTTNSAPRDPSLVAEETPVVTQESLGGRNEGLNIPDAPESQATPTRPQAAQGRPLDEIKSNFGDDEVWDRIEGLFGEDFVKNVTAGLADDEVNTTLRELLGQLDKVEQ